MCMCMRGLRCAKGGGRYRAGPCVLASSTHIISMYRNKYSIQLAVGLAPDYSGVLPGAVLGVTVASAVVALVDFGRLIAVPAARVRISSRGSDKDSPADDS